MSEWMAHWHILMMTLEWQSRSMIMDMYGHQEDDDDDDDDNNITGNIQQ